MITPIGYGILFALLLAQFAGAAYLVHLFRRHYEFYKRARITDGVVLRVAKHCDTDGRSWVYSYRYFVDGVAYKIDEEFFSSLLRPHQGQTIAIYYPPTAPGQGRRSHPAHGPLFLGGALACFSIGLFIAVLMLRNI